MVKYIENLIIDDLKQFFSIKNLNEIEIKNIDIFIPLYQIYEYKNEILKNDFIINRILDNQTDKNFFYSLLKKDEILKSNSPSLMYHYAYDIIGGRFLEGENIIIKSTELAFRYARDIIGGQWEKGESENMNSEFRKDYINFLKNKDYDTTKLESKYP